MLDCFFDTTVLIAYLKKEDSRTAILIERVFARQVRAAISVITVAELWANADIVDPQQLTNRQALVSTLQVVPIDLNLAQAGGVLRLRYDLKLADALIAASCVHVGGHFFAKDPHFNRLLNAGILIGEVYQ